jgi:hypothetical protein
MISFIKLRVDKSSLLALAVARGCCRHYAKNNYLYCTHTLGIVHVCLWPRKSTPSESGPFVTSKVRHAGAAFEEYCTFFVHIYMGTPYNQRHAAHTRVNKVTDISLISMLT